MHEVSGADGALADVIHSWLHGEMPGDEELVGQMTQMAMSFRANGATVDETCEWVQVLVQSWLRHPSTSAPRPHPHLRLVTASAPN
jgi:hypothetical protein